MARDSVLTRVATGAAVGGAIGGAVGAVYGTYDAIRYKYHLVLPVAESITDPSFGLVPAGFPETDSYVVLKYPKIFRTCTIQGALVELTLLLLSFLERSCEAHCHRENVKHSKLFEKVEEFCNCDIELGQVVLGMEHPCSIDPRPNFPLKEPIACVPGLLKIRHIGQTTLGSAAVFSLFLAAGTLIRSH
ncbi:hypothetical protein JHK85_010334 [Glycine max]|nr:hypothetical protein JHK85_010334 [Glycine max]